MQEATTNKRLHPLLTAAAISVTVFSAVGVGAMTGLLPHSFSSTPQAQIASQAAETPLPTPPIGAGAVREASEAQASEMPPAAPASTPAKPVHKKPVHAKATPPVQIAQAPQAAPQAQGAPVPPPPPPAIEAPRPLPGVLGVVESVREVSKPAEKSNGVGPIAGGVAGAVVGNQFGHGTTKSVLTILGAAGGALAGKEIEKNVRTTKSWEINVRLDDGSYRTLTSEQPPFWHGGERVRMIDGKLQPA